MNYFKQECIPVGCVPPAAVAVSPAMYAPCHACPPCHTCPLCHAHLPAMHVPLTMHASFSPDTPLFATHAPFHHACPSFAMHAPLYHVSPIHHACPPLPHMPPYHTGPLFATHAPLTMHAPPVNRMTDRQV